MGLFSWLRELFVGSPSHGDDDWRRDDASRGESSLEGSEDSAAPLERNVRRLEPLRYRTSLVRTANDREASGSTPSYRYAPRNPRTGEWLDLSTDADDRWLDYYGLPHLTTPEELADWLEVSPGKLAWLTHRFTEGHRPPSEKSAHYHFHWIDKKSGGARLIEAPKPLLKSLQRKVLREIIEKIPPHPSAHGFVKGRSIVSNARPHVGRHTILKLDLENFYPSVRYRRVAAIFRSVGFSRDVAIWLARLTTSSAPYDLRFPAEAVVRSTAISRGTCRRGRRLRRGWRIFRRIPSTCG